MPKPKTTAERLARIHRNGLGPRGRLDADRDAILVEHGVLLNLDEPLCAVVDSKMAVMPSRRTPATILGRSDCNVGCSRPVVALLAGPSPDAATGMVLLGRGGRVEILGAADACWLAYGGPDCPRSMESRELLDCLDALRDWEGLPCTVRWLAKDSRERLAEVPSPGT